MNHKFNKIATILILITAIGGCVEWVKPEYQKTLYNDDGGYSHLAPKGWLMRTNNSTNLLSNKGIQLQKIVLIRNNHDEAFTHIKKHSKADMLASELAEMTLANQKAESTEINIDVISNKAVVVDNKDAFRLHTSFYNSKGLRIDRVVYGLIDDKGFYRLIYQAPKLHYFDTSLTDFEMVVKSFHRT